MSRGDRCALTAGLASDPGRANGLPRAAALRAASGGGLLIDVRRCVCIRLRHGLGLQRRTLALAAATITTALTAAALCFALTSAAFCTAPTSVALPRAATHCHALPGCQALPGRATPCHVLLRLATPCHALPGFCHTSATPCHALPRAPTPATHCQPCHASPHAATPCHARFPSDGLEEDLEEEEIRPLIYTLDMPERKRMADALAKGFEYLETRITGTCGPIYDCSAMYNVCRLVQVFDPAFAVMHATPQWVDDLANVKPLGALADMAKMKAQLRTSHLSNSRPRVHS